jgi:hypothetical protein
MSVIFRKLENVARPKTQDESIRAYRTSLMMATDRSSGKSIVMIVIVSIAIIILTVLILLSLGQFTTTSPLAASTQTPEKPTAQSSIPLAKKGLVTVASNRDIDAATNTSHQRVQGQSLALLSNNRYSIEKSQARFNELGTDLKSDNKRNSFVVLAENKIVDEHQQDKIISPVNDLARTGNDRSVAKQLPKTIPEVVLPGKTKIMKPLTKEALAVERRFDGIKVKVENNRQQVHGIVKQLKSAIKQNNDQQVEQLFGQLAKLKSEQSPYILKMRAYWYLKTKQYQSAKMVLNLSLQIKPNDVDSAINLVLANLGLSQNQNAKKIVDNWLEKYPNNQQLIKLSKQLN